MDIQKPKSYPFERRFYSLIKNIGAVFYTTSDLTVIIQVGSKALLQKLNSMNLGVGSNLQERFIGTNAAALSYLLHKEITTIGNEHYVDTLKGYSMCAIEAPDLDNKTIFAYAVYIAPCEYFTEYPAFILTMLTYISSYCIRTVFDTSERAILGDYMYQTAQNGSLGLIIVDNKGFILRTNSWIESSFGKAIQGQQLFTYIPELAGAMESLDIGHNSRMSEVYIESLDGKKKNYCYSTSVSRKNGEVIGMIIYISNPGETKQPNRPHNNFEANFTFDDLVGDSPVFQTAKILP